MINTPVTSDRIRTASQLAAFCLCILAMRWITVSAHGAERPNIVWLISEDNSVHYLKLYDPHGAETPRIAALAKHGLQFQNAFSCAPVCSVARTTLMTGCYAPRIGTQYHRRAVSVPMPEGVKMFPALLRDAGYYTSNNNKKDYNADETPGTWDESSRTASWRGRQPNQPFFHMQSFPASHESSLHFTRQQFETQATETDPLNVFVAPYHPDTDLFRYTVAKYHDNIQIIDGLIGEVVDQLQEDKQLDDTFIFYFGDHGGVLPRGKGYAYESGLHVPLVVYVPDNFKHLSPWTTGEKVSGMVQFVDFGATTLQLAGVPIPMEKIEGRPFLGTGVSANDVISRQNAFGYADRFDEKYDLVRTLRHGRFEYVRSFQPFNFDGLQNNYRYIMLAYQEWRELHGTGDLNSIQSQFFEARPAELLFDIDADPHEVRNLAQDPQYSNELLAMRQELQAQLKSMPDLSFYPESYLVATAFENPVGFGQSHLEDIARYIDIADLVLQDAASAQAGIRKALASEDWLDRYWGLICCSTFGSEADAFYETAKKLAAVDSNRLVRVRAAEFLSLSGQQDPRPVIMDCLQHCEDGVETNLILNTVVLLRDSGAQAEWKFQDSDVTPSATKDENVRRRLSYLTSLDRIPVDPQGRNRRSIR
ncbi:MAG: sulfatase-like hydrolase/transferase [Planctomycetales bacterium]|nr:sulfatase-like hydrolase/transferase [Planctomycetales bacterium]